jgi:hypothetical protein
MPEVEDCAYDAAPLAMPAVGSAESQPTMKQLSLATALAISLAVLGGTARAAEALAVPEAIVTRQQAFVVPFRGPQGPEAARQQVELHVSSDRGATWKRAATTTADRRGFKFRVPADGEYWFAIRAAGGRAAPPAGQRPGLVVIVDTVPPELTLDLEAGADGEIVANLRVGDPLLDPATLKLEYRAEGESAWQAVALEPIPDDAASPHSGRVTFWPPAHAARYQVRAEVHDRAGNPAVSQEEVEPASAAALADEPAESYGDSTVDDRLPVTPGGREFEEEEPTVEDSSWPADEVSDAPLLSGPRGPAARTSAGGDRLATARGLQPISTPLARRELEPPADEPPQRPSDDRADDVQTQMTPVLDRPPLGVRPRMVNARRFRLDYDIESVGPSGVRKVELWCTPDGGRVWRLNAVDDDNQSPIVGEVDAEGIYGFRILVHSGSGMVERAPEEGAIPEVWIGVDLTPPAGQIVRVDQGAGERSGQLMIHWEAEDNQPLERPIGLAFSGAPGGPWITIASALRNTGRYVWQVDQQVPDAVYLRLEVRDSAGNVAVDEPPDPVGIGRLRPRGRIRDVQPVE